MAKDSYKIPASISRSSLDHEIPLSPGGITMRPVALRQIFFWVIGIFVVFWTVTSSPAKSAGFGAIALFVIWGVLAVFYLGTTDDAKQMRVMSVGPLINYLPKASRNVITRRVANPGPFFGITSIAAIDEGGRLHFADGGQGQLYLVVGSASYLLFEEDRDQILNRVDSFWRKVDTGCQWVFITKKEPQRVTEQIGQLELRNQDLSIRDPDLLDLQDEQFDILRNFVGGQFHSIHQYLLIKGKNQEELRRGHMTLAAEVENSNLMFKYARVLDRGECIDLLSTFYQPTTSAVENLKG